MLVGSIRISLPFLGCKCGKRTNTCNDTTPVCEVELKCDVDHYKLSSNISVLSHAEIVADSSSSKCSFTTVVDLKSQPQGTQGIKQIPHFSRSVL